MFPIRNILLAVGLIAIATTEARAQGYVWPSATAPCNGTLQQCIDGNVSNFPISIDTNSPTNVVDAPNTDLIIHGNISLFAAPGRSPVFPAGVGINVSASSAAAVLIEGITLQQGGDVSFLSTAATGTSLFIVRNMRFAHLGVSGGGVIITNSGGGDLQINIRDNDYLRTGGAGIFASVNTTHGGISGEISFNRIDIPNDFSSAYGIVLGANGDAAWNSVVVAANRIRGSFVYGAICGVVKATPQGKLPISQWRFLDNVITPAIPGVGTGLCVFAGEGLADARIVNNTVVDVGTALNISARPFPPAPAVVFPVSGDFSNNLFAYNGTAVSVGAGASSQSNGYNLYFGNGSNGSGYVAGSGSRYDDPRLFSRSAPYLVANSPAIDSGSNTAWPGTAIWPSLDADGHRRAKRLGIDIGAYEYGDGWFDVLATASNTSGNTLLLNHSTTNGAPSARVFATPNYDLGHITYTAPPGAYWVVANSAWRLFSENISGMPSGAGFNVFSPAAPTTSGTFSDIGLFLHRMPGTGPTNSSAMLDHPSVNGRPDAIVMIGQNWNPQDAPASGGVYNNSHMTLQIYADDRWRVANVSGNSIPNDAAFNVYAQPPSPSAFRHYASAGNTVLNSTTLSHPLIDGKPCAKLMVTSVFGNGSFDVAYNSATSHWTIYAGNGMPDGAEFNVLFSPRQIEECSGSQMFWDGFE